MWLADELTLRAGAKYALAVAVAVALAEPVAEAVAVTVAVASWRVARLLRVAWARAAVSALNLAAWIADDLAFARAREPASLSALAFAASWALYCASLSARRSAGEATCDNDRGTWIPMRWAGGAACALVEDSARGTTMAAPTNMVVILRGVLMHQTSTRASGVRSRHWGLR